MCLRTLLSARTFDNFSHHPDTALSAWEIVLVLVNRDGIGASGQPQRVQERLPLRLFGTVFTGTFIASRKGSTLASPQQTTEKTSSPHKSQRQQHVVIWFLSNSGTNGVLHCPNTVRTPHENEATSTPTFQLEIE